MGCDDMAMSESKFMEYLNNGNFDDCEVAGTTVGEIRKGNYKPDGTNPVYIKSQACSVSQYFTFGGKTVQVRTSGYAKFADYEIDQRILDGVPVNLTGIFSIYTDKNWAMTDDRYDPEGLKTPQKQFTVIDLKDGVEIAD